MQTTSQKAQRAQQVLQLQVGTPRKHLSQVTQHIVFVQFHSYCKQNIRARQNASLHFTQNSLCTVFLTFEFLEMAAGLSAPAGEEETAGGLFSATEGEGAAGGALHLL